MHVFASSGRIRNATLHLPMQTDVAERFKFHSPDRVEELLPDGRNSIKSVTCEPCGEDPKRVRGTGRPKSSTWCISNFFNFERGASLRGSRRQRSQIGIRDKSTCIIYIYTYMNKNVYLYIHVHKRTALRTPACDVYKAARRRVLLCTGAQAVGVSLHVAQA